MRKYIDQIKISANENLKDTIFIDGKAVKVSNEIYKYALTLTKITSPANKPTHLCTYYKTI